MSPPNGGGRAYWRKRVEQVGLEATIREEMERLGFWPPAEATTQQAAAALATLRLRYGELGQLREELAGLEREIADTQDMGAILMEIRRRRIERVRAQREVRRRERAARIEERRRRDREWRRRTLPFLGRDVSGGLLYAGGAPEVRERLGLPPLETATDVATASGIT